MEVATEAIVLRRFDYSETSQVAHVLGLAEGRVSVLAKGIKRPNAALKGPLDLFHRARVTYRRRDESDLALLCRYEPLDGSAGLRRRLDRLYAGFYLLELAWEITRELDPVPETYRLVVRSLAALERAEPAAVAAILLAAELGLLEASGFELALSAPARSRGGPLSFFPREGGFLDPEEAPEGAHAIAVEPGIRAVLEALGRAGPVHAARIRPSAAQVAVMRRLLREVLEGVLEKPLRSEPYVRDWRHGFLRRAAAAASLRR